MNSVAYGTVMAKAAEDYKQVKMRWNKHYPADFTRMPQQIAARKCMNHAACKQQCSKHGCAAAIQAEPVALAAQEMLSQEAAARQRSTQDLNLEDLRGDTGLEKLHRDRLAELQREVEKRQVKQRRGHGEYQVRWVVAPLQAARWHGRCVSNRMYTSLSCCSLRPWADCASP